MSEPLVLVVLLGTRSDPSTEGMMTAARAALGDSAIVLADTSDAKTDAEAVSIGERVRARAIAQVQWTDGTHARLHVRVDTSDWADDEVAFQPQDVPSEKGRTLGYMLATMVQRIARSTAPPQIRPQMEAEGEAKRTAELTAPASTSSPPRKPEPDVEGRTPPARNAGTDLDVFAEGTGVLGGGATSAGGVAGARWWPLTHLGLRAAAGARAGHIGEADASTMTLFAAVGPGYRIAISTTVELGGRADFVLLQHSVTRDKPIPTTNARWLSATDLLVEASWSVGDTAALTGALGAELAFGTTSINVAGARVADIPQVRAVSELGVRFRF